MRYLHALLQIMIQVSFLKTRPFIKVRVFHRAKQGRNPHVGRRILADIKWQMLMTREAEHYVMSREQFEYINSYLTRCNVRI